MAEDLNPYQAPASEAASTGTSYGLSIEGPALVVPKDARLPEICVISGRRGPGLYRTLKLTYVPPWVYVTILASLLVMIIVMLIVQKRGTVTVWISDVERIRRRNAILLNWLLFFGALALFVLAGVLENGWPVVPGIALLVTPLVIYYVRLRIVYPGRIDQNRIWLRGIRPEVMTAMVEAAG